MTFIRGNVRRDLRALGRSRGKKRGMTKIEIDYGEQLEQRRRAGEIQWFAFESLKLRLADNTFLEPDYLVQVADGALEIHECKGFWEEDARIKFKVAAQLYPFRFVGVTHEKTVIRGMKVWQFEEFAT